MTDTLQRVQNPAYRLTVNKKDLSDASLRSFLLNSQSISRVLCPLQGVCHSSMHYVTIILKRSTLRLGRATLKRRFTWTCSLQDTRPVHRCTAGGLLPHLLTLTLAGGYFLLRYSAFAGSFLLGSGALCAARTFLLCLFTATATDCPTVFYLPVFACKAGFLCCKGKAKPCNKQMYMRGVVL